MAKIMLVEDDNNLREIYEARLMAEGYDIVTARDGEEALAVAVREKPDLIISDVMMPKISGFDMLDILRSTPETKDTKVIMMTALSQAEDKARAEKLGADRYLVKSQVTLEDVAKVAHEVLEGTPAGGIRPAIDAGPSETPPPAPVAEPVAVDAVAPVAPAAAAPEMPAATALVAPVSAPVVEPQPIPVAAAPPAKDDATENLVSAAAMAPPPSAGVTDLNPPIAPAPVAAEPAQVAVPATAAISEPVVLPAPAPPVTPPATADVEIEKTSAELWAAPVDAAISEAPKSAGTEVAEAKVDAAPSQNLADEEALIAEQIEKFMGAVPTAPADSGSTPVADVTTTVMPAPETTPVQEAPVTAAIPEPEKPKSTGEKVIQPLADTAPAGPTIHELAAQEVAKEAATGTVINPESPSAGGIDPNSLAL